MTSVSPRLLGLDNYTFTETLTNPETGASVTMTANAVFNGSRHAASRATSSSSRRWRPTSFGIFVEDLSADVHGPHPGFDDFCGLIAPLIGP